MKPKFRKWVELEEAKSLLIKAGRDGEAEFPTRVSAYLRICLPFGGVFERLPWQASFRALFLLMKWKNVEVELPILNVRMEDGRREVPEWGYRGRFWYFYSHLLASAYGWSAEYIAKMRVKDALAYIQEILAQEQMRREFEWSTSENAYAYDKNSKTSRFVPLPRPTWMTVVAEKKDARRLRSKIHVSMLPVGAGDYSALPEEFRRDYEKRPPLSEHDENVEVVSDPEPIHAEGSEGKPAG